MFCDIRTYLGILSLLDKVGYHHHSPPALDKMNADFSF